MSKENFIQSVTRAIHILKTFTRNKKETTLAILHREMGVSKTSLQRLLNTLEDHGFIEQDEVNKTYRLGIELYFLDQLVERNSTWLTNALPHMTDLKNAINETISLNIIHENTRKCIGYVASDHNLMTVTYIGESSPIYAGAAAKMLMAYL